MQGLRFKNVIPLQVIQDWLLFTAFYGRDCGHVQIVPGETQPQSLKISLVIRRAVGSPAEDQF